MAPAVAWGSEFSSDLGCQVTILGGDPDGCFRIPPSRRRRIWPASATKVVAAGAEVGFCQDPDADRLALIDEQGRYIGEEYTVAICLEQVLRERSGAGGDQLFHQSHVGRSGDKIWRPVLSLAGG